MDFDAFFHEESYAKACELVGPNAHEFESVLDAIHDDVEWTNQCRTEWARQCAAKEAKE